MASNRQYEYFGNQNPTLNGKYNRGRVDAQRLSNDKAALGNMNTPFGLGYQIGSTIGNAWADAYNARGVSKGKAEMNDALNGYLGQYAQQPKTEVEQGGVLNNAMTGTQPSEEMLNNNSAQIQGGVLNGVDNMIAPMSPQDAYKAYKNDAWVSKYRGDDPNPDSTAIAVKNDTQEMNQLGNNVNFDNVDKEQAREYVRQQLEAKGRTPYQIDQVLGQFDSIYDSKYNKWNEAKGTDYLNKGMEALNGENPDYNTAFNNFAAAAQRGNKQAQMQLQRLQYLQARQDKIDAENRAYQRQMDMLNYKRSLGIGTGRGGGSGNGSASTTNPNGRWIGRRDAVTEKEHTAALSALKRYDGLEQLTPAQEKARQYAEDTVNRYNSKNHGAVRGYNIDSPEDVENYVRGVADNVKNNPNASGTDILNVLRNDGIMESPYWDDRYLELLGLSSDGTNND